jgi:hypothetical protein
LTARLVDVVWTVVVVVVPAVEVDAAVVPGAVVEVGVAPEVVEEYGPIASSPERNHHSPGSATKAASAKATATTACFDQRRGAGIGAPTGSCGGSGAWLSK